MEKRVLLSQFVSNGGKFSQYGGEKLRKARVLSEDSSRIQKEESGRKSKLLRMKFALEFRGKNLEERAALEFVENFEKEREKMTLELVRLLNEKGGPVSEYCF